MGSTTSDHKVTDSRLGLKGVRICLYSKPTCLHRHPTAGWSTLLRPSIAHSYKYGNINPFSISYAFQPRLRGRLTLGRLTLPRKPWVYGERVFHPFYRYLCQHNHFPPVHDGLRLALLPDGNALLPIVNKDYPKASVPCLAPLHFRREVIRPVSYYAFFKRWLLLSQLPGCLNDFTTLTTEHGFGDLSCWSGLFPSRLRIFAPAV